MTRYIPNMIHSALAASVIVGGLTVTAGAKEHPLPGQRETIQLQQGMQVIQPRPQTKGKLRLKRKRSNSGVGVFGSNQGSNTGSDFDYAIRSVGQSDCTYQGQEPSTVRFKVKNFGSEKPTQSVGVFVQFYNSNMSPGTAVTSSVAPINPGQERLVVLQVPAGVSENFSEGIHWKFQMVVNINNGAGGGIQVLEEDNLGNNVVQGSCWLAVL
ncbi:hypothetical protein MNBD_ALPHA07-1305 [hydrothermal vent metagenome]|uniref:CARDB domain-containing protein n=1 Tax=hydrothermal vent metagenome TaxID=652676 RepID=A0A3B0SHF7_9ZZZZ